jgi:hypothetical protein
LRRGGFQQNIIVDLILEPGIETKHPEIGRQFSEVVVADEFHS